MAENLEPCPFCGAEAVLTASPWNTWVKCDRASCGVLGPTGGNIADAIRLWNRRPQKEPKP